MPMGVAQFLTDAGKDEPVTFFDSIPPPSTEKLVCDALPHARVRTAGVVRGKLKGAGVDRGNTLCTTTAPLQEGAVTLWRFTGMNPGAEGSFSVGMSTPALFGPSWALRGISQLNNGNLCGQGMLIGAWGDSFTGSATVDWFVELQGTTVNVYPSVNGKPQGHAFQLDFSSKPELIEHLRPTILFDDTSNNLKVALIEFTPVPIPSGDAPYHRTSSEPRTSPEGKWELLASSFPTLVLPESVTLTVLADRVSWKVCNSVSAAAHFNDDGTASISKDMMSTRMMPMPALSPAEDAMKEFMPKISNWRIEDDILTLDNAARSRPIQFRAMNSRGGPVTSNLFLEFASQILEMTHLH